MISEPKEKLMQGHSTFIAIITAFFILNEPAMAQDNIFIYGRVTTISGDKYEGPIRWGKEEVYWTDLFNASKSENEFLDYLSEDQLEELKQKHRDDWNVSTEWISVSWNSRDYEEDFVHQFVCQFGEISRIVPTGREEAEVTLQNGMTFQLEGKGYNDVNTQVKVIDKELGIIELAWSRIDEIAFLKTPGKLPQKYGEPLYGTVECSAGKFSGYIQWDHDERVSEDKLDGDTEDGDFSIPFGSVASIERYGSTRSIVVLESGRDLVLRGSNDVNNENRGVVVTVAGLGRIDIPWDEFDKVTFADAPDKGAGYNNFNKQEKLAATVDMINGDQIQGDLIFDLDEAYNYEVLQGKMADVKFIIPFRNIKSIEPKNHDHCEVELRNAGSFVLRDSQDVSEKNQGLVVFNGSKPVYISYQDMQRITF